MDAENDQAKRPEEDDEAIMQAPRDESADHGDLQIGGVGSGYASTFRFRAEWMPKTIRPNVPRRTMKRLCRLHVMRARTMGIFRSEESDPDMPLHSDSALNGCRKRSGQTSRGGR